MTHISPQGKATASRFVDRQQETEKVVSLLETCRLVTLTGPPGIGKTRLAREVAAMVADGQDKGTCSVEVGSAVDATGLASIVGKATGAAERGRGPVIDTVLDHLATRNLLLVLDGCEHVAEACGDLAHAVLGACPGVSILATSQQPLGTEGERTLQVPPLPLPEATQPAARGNGRDDVLECGALELFLDSAAAVQGGISPSEETYPAIVEICRRLDGIPLAIELAAGRTNTLTLAQVSTGLEERFELLTGEMGTSPASVNSLRAALDRSHGLLSATEKTLLARLSVFAGGATLEAVDEVCAGGELSSGRLLEHLSTLIAKSWVVADTGAREARYRLLETLRLYASERLDSAPEASETRRRHAAWYLALAEHAEPELNRAEQKAWFERLDAEQENLRTAFDWALSTEDAQYCLRLAGSLSEFWRMAGRFDEGAELVEAALNARGSHQDAARAKALRGKASLLMMTGEWPAARTLLEEALALSRHAGDDSGSAQCLHRLGLVAVLQRDSGAGVPMIEEAIALARSSGDTGALAASLCAKGQACAFAADPSGAVTCFEECLELARRAGDAERVVNASSGLSWAVWGQGNLVEAERLLTQSLSSVREMGTYGAEAVVLTSLAQLNRIQGCYEKARALADEAVTIASEADAPVRLALGLTEMGQISLVQGDAAGARRLFEQALSLPSPGRVGLAEPKALVGLGEALLELGDDIGGQDRLEQGLSRANHGGDRLSAARALWGLGGVAQREEQNEKAASLYREALVIQHQANDLVGIVDSLEALADLAASSAGPERAARLLGAAQALRERPQLRYARGWKAATRYSATTAFLRQRLGGEQLEAALAQGRAMSQADAVAYALRGRRTERRPSAGWDSLSGAEREVVALVQQRLTNAEIGKRLFISPRTVQTHLKHIFSKVGVSSRRQLAEEATRRHIPDGHDVASR